MKGYNWNKVFFSDEKDFVLGAGQGYAWQQENLNSDVYINILNSRLKENRITFTKRLKKWQFYKRGREHILQKNR